MISFIIRRLLISIPVLILSSVLVFLLVANSGDPLGELKGRNPPVPQQVLDLRRHDLNLDKPLPARYWIWVTHFVRGDMGTSIGGLNVRTLLGQRLVVTMRMIILATLLALVLAVLTGVISAVRQYHISDYTFTFAGFLFLSMPVFWLAALLKEYVAIKFNQAFGHRVFYTVGDQTPNFTGPLLNRLATVVAVDTGTLFGGAILTEAVFSWHGMGDLLVRGIYQIDTNVVLAWLMVSAIIIILFNLAADILYAVLDPRIR